VGVSGACRTDKNLEKKVGPKELKQSVTAGARLLDCAIDTNTGLNDFLERMMGIPRCQTK